MIEGELMTWQGRAEAAEARIRELEAERDKLQAFKTWIHAYLTAKGVSEYPRGPHTKEGCRIGDRIDLVFAERDRWQRDCEAALQVCAENDLSLGQTVTMPLKLSAQLELMKAERGAALKRAEAAEEARQEMRAEINRVIPQNVELLRRTNAAESGLDELQSVCAAMRAALELFTDAPGYCEVHLNAVKNALASDAGKGWLSPEEADKLRADCAAMRDVLEQLANEANWSMGNSWIRPGYPHAIARAALASDAGKAWLSLREAEKLRATCTVMRKALEVAKSVICDCAEVSPPCCHECAATTAALASSL